MKKRWSSVDTHQPTDVIEETTVISLIGKFDQEKIDSAENLSIFTLAGLDIA